MKPHEIEIKFSSINGQLAMLNKKIENIEDKLLQMHRTQTKQNRLLEKVVAALSEKGINIEGEDRS